MTQVRTMALALTLAAGPGRAADSAVAVAGRDHGFYFNRSGATVADLDADTLRCEKLAAKTVPSARAMPAPA